MRNWTIYLAGIGAAVTLLAGCGGGGDSGSKVASVSSPPNTAASAPGKGGGGSDNGDDMENMRKFAKCMRDHGVNLPDPDPDGSRMGAIPEAEANNPKLAPATEACKSLLPNGGEDPLKDPVQLDKLRQKAKCMREHGIDMPDPEPGKSVQLGGRGDDPKKVEEAMKACGLDVG
jgi:hypothetical protein